MSKNAAPPPPAGSLVLTPSAIAFSFGMLAVGLVMGYLIGTSSNAAPTPADGPPAIAAQADGPSGKVVNNTPGELRKLSAEEKADLMQKRAEAEKKAQASAEPDEGTIFWTPTIEAALQDDITRAEFKRAVALMNQGNARGARPTLVKLDGSSKGKAWREPLLALLAEARAATGEVDEARKDVAAFRSEFGSKGPYAATVAVAEAKTHMQEGKRARTAGQKSEDMNAQKRAAYTKAIAGFAKAIESWPSHESVADAYLNKSALHIELEQWEDAERAALGLALKFPDHRNAPRALANVGRAAMDAGDFTLAERAYQQLVDSFPRDRMAQSARSKLSSLTLLGKPAPDLDVEEWLGNDIGPLSKNKGKVVLLVFWATWCPHCRREMPHIEELHNKYKDDGLVVVGVTRNSKGQTTDKVREYIGSNGLTLPVAIDPGGTSRSYGVSGIPASAVVGKDGTVVYRNHPAQITDAMLEGWLGKKG